MKWEYLLFQLPDEGSWKQALDEMGSRGWELIQLVQSEAFGAIRFTAIFKRSLHE